MTLLKVDKLQVCYQEIVAVRDLSFSLAAGESVALLGANGAGKTSAVEAIAGLIPVKSGSVFFEGEDITRRSASDTARRGLSLVPQWRELFSNFSVEETLIAGMAAARDREPRTLDEIYELFPALAQRRTQLAGSLSGGEQQMLAIGRSLIGRPKAILLDEPSAGLAAGIIRFMVETISRIRQTGVALLVVEQKLELAQALADRCLVLSVGRTVLEGPMREAAHMEQIRGAFFE